MLEEIDSNSKESPPENSVINVKQAIVSRIVVQHTLYHLNILCPLQRMLTKSLAVFTYTLFKISGEVPRAIYS